MSYSLPWFSFLSQHLLRSLLQDTRWLFSGAEFVLGGEADVCCEMKQGQRVQMIQEGVLMKAAELHLAGLEPMTALAPKGLPCH